MHITSDVFAEMIEGGIAEMCADKLLHVSSVGQAPPASSGRRGERTPIGAGGNFDCFYITVCYEYSYIFLLIC